MSENDDDLDWDLDERDAYLEEHADDPDEPDVDVLVRTDE